MKRYVMPIVIFFLLVSGLSVGCTPGLQTYNKHGISFQVSKKLILEEYTVSFQDQIFKKGTANYEDGWVMSNEKNFVFMWITRPEMTAEEVKLSILTTPNVFQSASGIFQAKIAGDLVKQQIAGFEVTSAMMQFTMPGWEASGITAVWYSAASHRMMQLILINRYAEREMRRFIRSFADTSS